MRRQSFSPVGEPDRKAKQLCRQVEQALALILPGCADDCLRDLVVISVEPAPHTGRLRVTVVAPPATDVTHRTACQQRLLQASSWLRREVAASIVRRRAPELVFVVQ